MGGTQASQAIMGGASVAVYDPYSVIQVNPASYASLKRPVFETAVMFRGQEYISVGNRQFGNRSDLLGLTLGIPFANGRWGIALGMNPVSKVAYTISEQSPIGATGQNVEFQYSGLGGLNRAFGGVGRSIPFRNDSLGNGSQLSMGVNFNYDFGSIDEISKAYYPRSAGYLNSRVQSSLSVYGLVVGVGARFQGDLVKRTHRSHSGLRYMIGAAAELPSDLSASQSRFASSFILGATGVEFEVDTSSVIRGAKGSVGLPPQYSVGFSLLNDKWSATMEYRRRDWTRLSVDLQDYRAGSGLGVNTSYIVGGSYRPAGDGRGTFWSTAIYRAGFRYTDDYLVVNGMQLQQIGMSFGMSLPLMSSTTRSRVNIGTELGRKGSQENGLIQERFAHFYLGITITPDLREQWFKKRRIE
jgi:hypothetical protein